MKHLDVSPDVVEQLAFDNADAVIEYSPATRRMSIDVDGDTYVSTPLPLLGRAS